MKHHRSAASTVRNLTLLIGLLAAGLLASGCSGKGVGDTVPGPPPALVQKNGPPPVAVAGSPAQKPK